MGALGDAGMGDGLGAFEDGADPRDPPIEGGRTEGEEDPSLEALVEAWSDALGLEGKRALEARIALAVRPALELRVRSVLRRSGGANAASVEDAVHETIAELPKVLASYLESARPSAAAGGRGSGGFRSYLMSTARNVTRDLVERQRRERERLARMAQSHPSKLGHAPTTPSQRAMRSEIDLIFAAELARLDELDRAIVERRVARMGSAEIGRELGMPRETVRDRWEACRVRLRRALGSALGGDPLTD